MSKNISQKTNKDRIQSIDALRGLAVVLMVAHHFLFDLVAFLNAPSWLFDNLLFNILQPVFAGCFIMLSGVSSRFSRSNVKRGLRVLAAACIISIVTWFMHMPILFGILHFLGVAMVLYGLTHTFWEKLPQRMAPWLFALLLAASVVLLRQVETESHYLWILGFTYHGFDSADYFPLLPWIFVFLFGAWLGRPIKERRLPTCVYTLNPPLFPAVGRHAFIIYLLHQPILYGIIILLQLTISN